jgi:hypothetical protein
MIDTSDMEEDWDLIRPNRKPDPLKQARSLIPREIATFRESNKKDWMTVEGRSTWLNKIIHQVTNRITRTNPESEFGGFYLDLLSQLLEVCTGEETVNALDLELTIIRLTEVMNRGATGNGV